MTLEWTTHLTLSCNSKNLTFLPTDQSDTAGQVFFESRMIPTPPDQSDDMHPSFNPQALGSRPRRPTKEFWRTFVPESQIIIRCHSRTGPQNGLQFFEHYMKGFESEDMTLESAMSQESDEQVVSRCPAHLYRHISARE
jgi:hypothetical protein